MQQTASSLLNLKKVAECKKGEDNKMKAVEKSRAFRIEQEVIINAPREKVFNALTENVQDWWEFRIAPKGSHQRLHWNLFRVDNL